MEISECQASGFDDNIKQIVSSWGIQELTHIQQIALDKGAANGQSLVVSSPTSSGKTLVGEIALLVALKNNKKCLYLVSHKALADQKYSDFEDRFGISGGQHLATVGLSTGDREEGESQPQLLVATYEKALAMALSEQIDFKNLVVIADELQIIGEEGRGPNIEALCSIIRQQAISQFIALTATVGNPQEIAYWLNCELASSTSRDIELFQQIWYENQVYTVRFGDDAGTTTNAGREVLPNDVVNVTRRLVSEGQAPVLVFTESRKEAIQYAESYSQTEQQKAHGIALAEQLDLFSEPTEASEQLLANARKGVAFHSADLTAQERQVIEQGILDSKIQVCFATSTLAAGVNFPFKTVVFPKLTYQWIAPGDHIKKTDYRNMSGRAGRLGLHDDGYSVLLPKNTVELRHANEIILPVNDNVNSQLVNISMRRTVLMLVSSRIIDSAAKIREFFENTYFWYQISEKNPAQLDNIVSKASMAVQWLQDNNLIDNREGVLLATPVGKAVSESGLLPTTALDFLGVLPAYVANMELDFNQYIIGMIHWACQSEEFCGQTPSRFLPYPSDRKPVSSNDYLASSILLCPLDRTNNRVNQCAHAISLFCNGLEDRKIRFQTNMASGSVHRLALDVAWVLEGLQRITSVPELNFPQTLTNNISMLARRVRWGAPAEALDLLRVAQKNNVPGFGRQRALAVLSSGLSTFEEIISASKDKLVSIVRNENRASALLSAITGSIGLNVNRFEKIHIQVADNLGLSDIVKRCYSDYGTDYELAIKRLLESESSLAIKCLDDGKQQNVPDLMVSFQNTHILLECKTATKKPPLINKEDAWAVLQKSTDYDPMMHRVTLGKPGFDEHSKKKVLSAKDIGLVESSVFIEGLLRLLAGSISPRQFVEWLAVPGLIEIERLQGDKTYEIARR
ncbi:MAG: DEAD/DEAH box helicase [Candidatus Thiodiazotropha taylori]|nr:DEAD/DEAH box helicase [Candidatus Thiodiazotropha taylori]